MLDVSLRVADVVLLCLAAGLLARARRRDHTPWVGIAFALSLAAFVITSTPGISPALGLAVLPLTGLCVAKPVFLALFARGLFAESLRLRLREWLLIVAMMAAGIWHELSFSPHAASAMALAGSFAFKAASLAFVLMAPLAVLRGRTLDLDERRRQWRLWFVAAISIYLVAVIAVQATTLLLAIRTPAPLVTLNLAIIGLGALLALATLAQLRPVSWLEAAVPAPAAALPSGDQALLARIQRLMDEEHAYREEGLTVTRLAARLGLREEPVRRAINRGLGFRNFNDFLHSYRIREACERLRQGERLPVLSIALDAGYASIGPFNRAFKARIGMTPTEFRQSLRSEA